MQCPQCRRSTRVLSSHAVESIVKRIRQCNMCDYRFRTEEKFVTMLPTVGKEPDPLQRKEERKIWHRHHRT